MSKSLQRLAWPAGFALLLLAYFSPALFSGRVLAPGDGIAQFLPIRVLIAQCVRAGEWPFWNPYSYGGTPLLAAIQGGVFFPGNWGFLFLPPTWAMNLAVMATYWLAGVGTYGLGRAQGLSRTAASVSALTFALGGYMVAHMEHLAILQIASLLPWALWMVERFCRSGRAGYAWAIALISALQIVAGHPQTTVFSFLLAIAYGLWRLTDVPAARRSRTFAMLGGAVVLGIGLSLVQLLPTLDYVPRTIRQHITYDWLVSRSLPPVHLLTWVFPRFFGGVPTAWFPTPYWSVPAISELTGYAGLAAIALAVIGGLFARRARFWLACAGLGMLLALGSSTPLYALVARLPLLDQMPVPSRHLLEVGLSIALLAGFGLQCVLDAAPRARRRLLLFGWAAVALPALGVALAIAASGQRYATHVQPYLPPGIDLHAALRLQQPAFWLPLAATALLGLVFAVFARRRDRLASALLIGFIVLDLASFGLNEGWLQTSPRLDGAPHVAATPSDARTTSFADSPFYPYDDFPLIAALHFPNWGCVDGTRTLGGYDAFVEAGFAGLMAGVYGFKGTDPSRVLAPAHHGLDLFDGRVLRLDQALASRPEIQALLRAPRWEPLPAPAGTRAYLNRRALPSAWRVQRVRRASEDAIKRAIQTDPGFDPAVEALWERPADPGMLVGGPARVVTRSFDHIRLETHGAGPGVVVVSEGFDPDWRAFCQGQALPVVCVDGALIGLVVPAGDCAIDLRYAPRLWPVALTGSAVSALILLFWGLWLLGHRAPGVAWPVEHAA